MFNKRKGIKRLFGVINMVPIKKIIKLHNKDQGKTFTTFIIIKTLKKTS